MGNNIKELTKRIIDLRDAKKFKGNAKKYTELEKEEDWAHYGEI